MTEVVCNTARSGVHRISHAIASHYYITDSVNPNTGPLDSNATTSTASCVCYAYWNDLIIMRMWVNYAGFDLYTRVMHREVPKRNEGSYVFLWSNSRIFNLFLGGAEVYNGFKFNQSKALCNLTDFSGRNSSPWLTLLLKATGLQWFGGSELGKVNFHISTFKRSL